jgi:hypothetical protein
MKKFYLAAATLTFIKLSFGQLILPQGDKPINTIPLKSTGKTKVELDRGSAFWSEDFSNGMTSTNGNWTVGDVDGNIWKHSYFTTSGEWSAGTPNPGFTTETNGFMLFDLDSVNALVSPNYIDKTGELISPSIDCSGENSVNLIFEHNFRWCCVAPSVTLEVSNDGGLNWTPFDVLDGVPASGSSGFPVYRSVNISTIAANQANVMIKFRWTGSSHYYWAIDDISLLPSPAHEIEILQSTYLSEIPAGNSGVPYTIVPVNHAQDFKSFAEITNQGQNTETVTLYSDLTQVGTTISSVSGVGNNLSSASTINDQTSVWTSPSTIGQYQIKNYVQYSNIGLDADTSNNSQSWNFEVSANEYARDEGLYAGGLWNGAGNPYEMGPVYTLMQDDSLRTIRAAFAANTVPGTIVYPVVYRIDTVSGAFTAVFSGSGSLCEHTIIATDISSPGNVVFVNLNIDADGLGRALDLEAGGEYIIGIGHYGGPDDVTILNGGVEAPDQTVFILDGTDNTWYYMTSTPSIRAVFGGGDSLCNPIGLEEASIAIRLEQNYPNPVSSLATISYYLNEAAHISFTVTDIAGKVILTSDEGTVVAGEHTFEINTANLAEGMYNYTINANGITMTKRMVVNH